MCDLCGKKTDGTMCNLVDEEYTCWDCEARIGEECDYDGHEVYPDSEICDNFEKK